MTRCLYKLKKPKEIPRFLSLKWIFFMEKLFLSMFTFLIYIDHILLHHCLSVQILITRAVLQDSLGTATFAVVKPQLFLNSWPVGCDGHSTSPPGLFVSQCLKALSDLNLANIVPETETPARPKMSSVKFWQPSQNFSPIVCCSNAFNWVLLRGISNISNIFCIKKSVYSICHL